MDQIELFDDFYYNSEDCPPLPAKINNFLLPLEKTRALGTIGVMWMDCVRGKFVKSLVNMISHSKDTLETPETYLNIDYATCSYHQLARNQLAENFRGDWIFMCDTDHIFAPDLLTRLLHLSYKYNAKVVSGIYQFKFPPHGPVANIWTEDGKAVQIQKWNPNAEMLKIGCVGGGALLIYREVFDRIGAELKEQPFSEYNGLSEDYSFCHRCKRLDIPVYLAPKVESHHMIDTALSIEDFVPPDMSVLTPVYNGKVVK